MLMDLGKLGSECINGGLRLVFLVITNCAYFAKWFRALSLSGGEAWEDDAVVDLPKAIIGSEAKEFGELSVVETNNASCLEGSASCGGVQDIDRGFADGASGNIFYAKRDGKCNGQEDDIV